MKRRELLMMGASTGLGAGLAGRFGWTARAATNNSALKLGACSYSLRSFQRRLAISILKQLGAQYVSVKDVHLPYTVSAEDAAKAKAEFQRAGLTIVSGGTVPLQDEDAAALRRYFEYARLCGMPMMVTAPTHRTLGMVEKLAKEFDIKIAIHNHGPEDQHFPTPQSVLAEVQHMDPRMGLCMDVGHSLRAGVDIVKAMSDAGSRLLDIHFKDLRSASDKGSDCDVGEGVMPVVPIFKQLKAMSYQGCVNLEYEHNVDNPLPGMLHSLGYMRGVLAGLNG